LGGRCCRRYLRGARRRRRPMRRELRSQRCPVVGPWRGLLIVEKLECSLNRVSTSTLTDRAREVKGRGGTGAVGGAMLEGSARARGGALPAVSRGASAPPQQRSPAPPCLS